MAVDIFDPDVKAESKRSYDAGMWSVLRQVCDLFRKTDDNRFLYSLITDGPVTYAEAMYQLEDVYRLLCEFVSPERWQMIIEEAKKRSEEG